jgi:hypothetical protein
MGPASGGSGNLTYVWLRTGTSSATLTGAAATYPLNSDVSNYVAPGTYYFNRYVKDNIYNCVAAAAGTYTLGVSSVGVPTTLCTACCWSGSTWVDCLVSFEPYGSRWSGNDLTYYPGAVSDRDGATNTAAISNPSSNSAVYKCTSHGQGWYLPAIEELVCMADSLSYVPSPPLNGRPPAGLFNDNSNYWSSTEWYGSAGRFGSTSPSRQNLALAVDCGYMVNGFGKNGNWKFVCVKRL